MVRRGFSPRSAAFFVLNSALAVPPIAFDGFSEQLHVLRHYAVAIKPFPRRESALNQQGRQAKYHR